MIVTVYESMSQSPLRVRAIIKIFAKWRFQIPHSLYMVFVVSDFRFSAKFWSRSLRFWTAVVDFPFSAKIPYLGLSVFAVLDFLFSAKFPSSRSLWFQTRTISF